MHDTAYELGTKFFAVYAPPKAFILDVGALDINGSLKTCAPPDARYFGLDTEAGKGVDMVLDDLYSLPFKDGVFDLVVSSYAMQHDSMFWLSFLELGRVIKPGGYIYVNVPSNGWYHANPIDAWRCYPDAGLALQNWARRQGQDISLVESFVAPRQEVIWNDFVMIFARGELARPSGRVADQVPGTMNVRVAEAIDELRNTEVDPEDLRTINRLTQELEEKTRRVQQLERTLENYRQSAERVISVPGK